MVLSAEDQHEKRTVSIDDDIEVLNEQITAVRELGRWDDAGASDEERIYDVSIGWGAALAGRLPRLTHFRARRRFADADEARFQRLCSELREIAPLVRRFGFREPNLD